jgi:hypothetical protein
MQRAAVILTAGLMFAIPTAGSAQELASYQPNSCQKFAGGRTDQEAVYLRAACVAARAGVASPANGALSREELLSILMLMSLPQTNASRS